MEREHGVDRVKAVATVCVVAIHCQPFFAIGRPHLLGRVIPVLLEWAVPAFFFVGGYVRARTTPYSPGTTGRWLTRLLPAYLLGSLLALLCRRFVFEEPVTIGDVPLGLVIGSAWGIYYFIPLFLGALVFSHALARWPQSVPWISALSIMCLVLTRWDAELDPFWRAAGFDGIVRSPFFWWGYFCAGWVVKQKLEIARSRKRIWVLSSIAALICMLALLANVTPLERALARVGASIAIPMSLLFWSTRPLGAAPALLSRYSYEIYIFHFFAISLAGHWGFPGTTAVGSLTLCAVAIASGLAAAILWGHALQRSRYTAAASP